MGHEISECTWRPSRREMEQMELRSIAANAELPITERAVAVLTQHQRLFTPDSCLCGWEELGKSFSRHQALKLQEAGLWNPLKVPVESTAEALLKDVREAARRAAKQGVKVDAITFEAAGGGIDGA